MASLAAGRRIVREPSWDSLRQSEVSDDGYDPDDEVDDEDEPLMTIGDVHRALHPLQATADRVGKQAEQFAESLDRLSPQTQENKPAQVKDILPLVQQYEKIAAETVKRLKRYHEQARQELLQRSFSRRLKKESGLSTPSEFYQEEESRDPASTTVEDLDHWEHERQTWQLFGLMIQARSRADHSSEGLPENFTKPKNTPKPHRYSTEHDVWSYFLEHSPEIWEKHVVVEWLKSNANSTGQDIDTIVDELELNKERGSDLWAHGWMYSKEVIKAEKRLRSWPQPLDPSSPGVGKSIVQSKGAENVVTQLDPDAFSRQGRILAEEDLLFERAAWLACWEMLRRGYDWATIREWSEERVELWRSLSMRGDPRPSHDSSEGGSASTCQSRALWRKMCMKLARKGGVDAYERAVYGMLSGDLASVDKVARTWDDVLFAHYNSQVLQNFDIYVQRTFPARLPNFRGRSRDDMAVTSLDMDGGQAWDLLLRSEVTKEEALIPFKLLQGSIIANRTGGYLVAQAYALSQVLHKGDAEAKKLARLFQHSSTDATAPIQLSSYDLMRVLTHVAFALQDLGQLGANAHGIEQIVIAYVDFLGKAGKQQLLPLYASRLSSNGAVECMGRQLPSIVDNGERKTMLNLMHQYEMDVPAILLMQIVLITRDQPVDVNTKIGYPPLRVLEQVPEGQHALPTIRADFLGEDIQDEDWDLINGMEWYLLLDKHWKETMYAGSLVYKYLLLTGSLAAARELSRRVPFSTISLNKTEDLLGASIDLGIFSDDDTSQPPSPHRRRGTRNAPAPPSPPSQAQRSFLLSSSTTFRDLEALLLALDALDTFARAATPFTGTHPEAYYTTDAARAKAWKNDLQRSSDAVSAALEPLLAPGWLNRPGTPREGAELAAIRASYLPEVVLAYLSVLGIGGQVLSREVLLRGLDLAALIAGAGDAGDASAGTGSGGAARKKNISARSPLEADDREELSRCFVRAGRVAELVDALAVLGRMVVKADEAGGKKKGRKAGRKGSEGLGIWSVAGAKKGQREGE